MEPIIIYLNQPSTPGDLETRHASRKLTGDPPIEFEQITPVLFRVTLAGHPRHPYAPFRPTAWCRTASRSGQILPLRDAIRHSFLERCTAPSPSRTHPAALVVTSARRSRNFQLPRPSAPGSGSARNEKSAVVKCCPQGRVLPKIAPLWPYGSPPRPYTKARPSSGTTSVAWKAASVRPKRFPRSHTNSRVLSTIYGHRPAGVDATIFQEQERRLQDRKRKKLCAQAREMGLQVVPAEAVP
jgi:hypothetical protein